jgi:predicted acyl esterase
VPTEGSGRESDTYTYDPNDPCPFLTEWTSAQIGILSFSLSLSHSLSPPPIHRWTQAEQTTTHKLNCGVLFLPSLRSTLWSCGTDVADDVLVYTSEVLKEDLEVTGPLLVTLFASSSAPDTDFTAKAFSLSFDLCLLGAFGRSFVSYAASCWTCGRTGSRSGLRTEWSGRAFGKACGRTR